MASDDVELLRKQPRKNVEVEVRVESEVYSNVAVHLKGTGTFRGIDEKPSWTLGFEDPKFHGLSKIHLNNSIEDTTYLHEFIGSEMFRAAGLPAPRVAHAMVELNGRKLGLYVLKEGFTEEFLSLYYKNYSGNLYDISAGHEVNETMDRVFGPGPDDQKDIRALGEACMETNYTKRWVGLEATLDVDRFMAFMAMEIMVGHRDGYCLAKNNFRVYHDLDTDRIVFFPHGMDVLFGKPDNTYKPFMNGLVAKSIMEVPKGQELYRKRFTELFVSAFRLERCLAVMDQRVSQIVPALSRKEATSLKEAAADLKDRISKRHDFLANQLLAADPKVVEFANRQYSLREWKKFDEPAGGRMEVGKSRDGRAALHIQAGPMTAATFRSHILLKQGRYRFEGKVMTEGVTPLTVGKVHGGTLRLLGRTRTAGDMLGDKAWQNLEAVFEVSSPEEEVDVICELRASKGDAWFDLDSLRLIELGPAESPAQPK
jgi:spore coat protein H